MKRNTTLGLVGLSLIWVPAVYCMGTPQDVQIEKQEDKVLPIVLVHGLKNDSSNMQTTKTILEKLCPGTKVYTPDIGFYGFAPCEAQIQELTNYINSEKELENGFNLIGYSLGGVISRGVVEEGKVPRVYSLVTFASPHRGVCGFPGSWDDDLDKKAKDYFNVEPITAIEKLAYKPLVAVEQLVSKLHIPLVDQLPICSVVDLWNEPTEHSTYLKHNKFLPYFNNEKSHSNFDAFKHNLTTVAAFVCLAGTKDATVEPWQSTHWDYFDSKRKKIDRLEDSSIYEKLGLHDLVVESKFNRITIEGASHGGIHQDEDLIKQHVLSKLTRESQREDDAGKSIYEEINVAPWRCFICCK